MRLPRTALALTALLLLTACAAGGPGAAPTTSAPAGGAGGGTDGGGEPAAPAEPAAPVLPASCTAIELVTGARVASADLATCLTDFIRAAGSGRFESRLEGQVSDQRWALVDGGLYAIGSRNGEPSLAVTPDTGWLFTDGAWVQADPNGTSEQMLAADGVDGYRATSEPQMTYAMVAVAPGFTVGERAEVQLADGTTTSLWPIRADGPFQPIPAIPATTTDLVIWTDVPGPTARIDVSNEMVDEQGRSYAGSSTTFYEDWGQGVDLAEIEALVGVPLPRP